MGIDLCYLDDQKEVLVTLDESALTKLEPAFKLLQAKSGVYVDPYGTTRISPDHAKIILSEIEKFAEASLSTRIRKTRSVLEHAKNNNDWLIALGD